MKKILLWVSFVALGLVQAAAQSAKTHPPAQGPAPSAEQLKFRPWPGKSSVPPAENPFGVLPGAVRKPMAPLQRLTPTDENIEMTRAENGLPIFFKGQTAASVSADASQTPGEHALAYLASLKPAGLTTPANEFVPKRVTADAQGGLHVRLEQVHQGIPVYGAEVIAHAKNGVFNMLNGRYFPTPKLGSTTPAISAAQALQTVMEDLGAANVKTEWTDRERALVGGAETSSELVVYHPEHDIDEERLTWHITIYPNVLRREVYFVDAQTGTILQHYHHTCEISGRKIPTQVSVPDICRHEHAGGLAPALLLDGPVTASGLDLMNQNRVFGAWMAGSTIYMEDASKPMFNSGASQMPSNPIGVIVTLDAKNTSPEVQPTFDFDLVSSPTTTFNNKNAVSTHWNAIQSYDYYRTKHSRNSIDGVGGNVISFFNVSEADGTSMENAYWNGAAMWYGNGGPNFYELARGLDVGGHEMTHGVIEKTANLEYLNESGALNESFADVFAVFIDPNDWKIGEDVVKPGATTNNCLRDVQDPHKSDPVQPNHVSEQYTGPQDNGGVHINSGIPNRAFYLFASNAAVGLEKAEKVYYKALTDYLVKSSQFIDCRLAVIQAANDLYGNAVANVAADAFTAVGIIGDQGGNYLGDLNINPGSDLIMCASDDLQNVDLADGLGQILGTLYGQTVASRPSVSDNGMQAVFVNSAGHVIGLDLVYQGNEIFVQDYEISFTPDWRSAAISKNGRFLAALSKVANDRIEIVDLADPLLVSETFFLYNPTYSTNQVTGEVRYADVLEFDYSGEYLMYDAFNELKNNQGEDLSYWDIGFLKFWENGAFVNGGDAFISKLFSGLPEKTSVGNPTFAKNSPYIIAFDVIDGLNNRNDVYGANTETGDLGIIVSNNQALGWPSYSRLDDAVIFDRPFGTSTNIFRQNLAPDKITGTGNPALLVSERNWGAWFANGTRSLMVDAGEAERTILRLSAAPNPATDVVRLNFTAPKAGPAQVVVSDMLGRVVLHREWSLPAGDNQLDLNLLDLPTGTYAIRLLTGGAGATIKLVKN